MQNKIKQNIPKKLRVGITINLKISFLVKQKTSFICNNKMQKIRVENFILKKRILMSIIFQFKY